MAELETSHPLAAYATKGNIVYPHPRAGGQSVAPDAAARTQIEDRLGYTDPEVTTTPPSSPAAARTLDAAPAIQEEP